MTRGEAIALLIYRDLANLSPRERESLLLDWWSIDASDPDYDGLPDLLKVALARTEEPDDPKKSLYRPLLQIALRRRYVGVLNSYLQRQIEGIGHHQVVFGDIEVLEACPCCGYRSLGQRGVYDICVVCFWEDDGTTEPDFYSAPNHMTLRDAQSNFRHLGAVSEEMRKHVLPDGRDRYASIDI